MQVNVHAGLMIALTGSTLLALLLLKRRSPTDRQMVIAFAIASFGAIAASILNRHLCREGDPRMQWLILGPCLFLVLAFAGSPAWRRVFGATLLIGMIGLSLHFTNLVHTTGWTGNPNFVGLGTIALRSVHGMIDTTANIPENRDAVYPAGWLRDLNVTCPNDDQFGGFDRLTERRRIERAWHTPFTGLYRYTSIQQDFWYPGGTFAEAGPMTLLRDRLSP